MGRVKLRGGKRTPFTVARCPLLRAERGRGCLAAVCLLASWYDARVLLEEERRGGKRT